MLEITTEEWLEELHRLEKTQPQQEGFTVAELAEILGRNLNTTRLILRKLIIAGSVEPLQVRRTSVLTGIARPVPGFRLAKRKVKK